MDIYDRIDSCAALCVSSGRRNIYRCGCKYPAADWTNRIAWRPIEYKWQVTAWAQSLFDTKRSDFGVRAVRNDSRTVADRSGIYFPSYWVCVALTLDSRPINLAPIYADLIVLPHNLANCLLKLIELTCFSSVSGPNFSLMDWGPQDFRWRSLRAIEWNLFHWNVMKIAEVITKLLTLLIIKSISSVTLELNCVQTRRPIGLCSKDFW